jgi:hypothetical protein
VILAIKPRFEEDVISLLDKGQLGSLSPASRSKSTVDAVRATEKRLEDQRVAATAPLAVASTRDDSPASSGDLSGEWFDWTPTSALDMDVSLKDLL